jgi:DNA polymerase-3 subunit gamma/tau
LTDQAIAFGSGILQEATVRQMLGSVDRSYVFRLLQALAQSDGKTVVETSEILRTHGLSAASTLEEMSGVLQRMAVLQAVPDSAQDDNDPEFAEITQLAALMPADETQLLYSICLHGRGELGLAPDEYAALTMVLLRLLAFKPAVNGVATQEKKTLKIAPRTSADTPARQPKTTPTQAPVSAPVVVPVPAVAVATSAGTPAAVMPQGHRLPVRDMPGAQTHVVTHEPLAAPIQAPVSPAVPPQAARIEAVQVHEQPDSRRDVPLERAATAVSGSPEGDFWYSTVQALIASEAISAMVRELALQSQLVARDSDQWLLRVERESLNQPGSRERLAAALATAGYPVSLVAEVGRVSDSPARRNAAAAAQAQLAAEKIVFDDPLVQSLMRDFGAKIVPGSIKPG